ncbi:MAG: YiiX family permuted papain-like enzyme [Flavobacteriales bacterium]|nr:YiiX family permuted papain-like enzyme [Flavobacteriales bacterium]
MKRIFLSVSVIALFLMGWARYQGTDDMPLNVDSVQDGDIIFQTSRSAQSTAIQLATHSRWSHMGIIFRQDGDWAVLEAVQPVKITPLDVWIQGGEGAHFAVKRLRNASEVLDDSIKSAMQQMGTQFLGKPYDIYFEWSDERMYCSELVWKIYQRTTNIELGKLQELADFDLTHEEVQSVLNQRYGSDLPVNELVISPEAMFNAEQLVLVVEG